MFLFKKPEQEKKRKNKNSPPKKKFKSIASLILPQGKKSNVSNNLFDPIPHQLMTSLIFFSYKYKNDCVIINFNRIHSKHSAPFSYHLISITYNEQTQRIKVPTKFWFQFTKCLKCTQRFIIFPLIIYWKNNNGSHANFMIYDSQQHSLERFEPYGKLPSHNIDKHLKETFRQKFGNSSIKKYYKPTSISPDDAFQAISEQENENIPSDPIGFCQAWSTWYADLRLSNPNIPVKTLIPLVLEKLKKKRSFTSFIRSYANFQHEFYKLILKTSPSNYSKVVQSFIR